MGLPADLTLCERGSILEKAVWRPYWAWLATPAAGSWGEDWRRGWGWGFTRLMRFVLLPALGDG